MIDPNKFADSLFEVGIKFAVGVPDSLLKYACLAINEKFKNKKHVIAANEGSAIGIAIGYYLANGAPALVYMQNSGLGNAINPLTSLADLEVYSIPMILMIGWRGEVDESNDTQIKDEPQHAKQGRITLKLLELLDIPYVVIDKNTKNIKELLAKQVQISLKRKGPAAIVVRKETFTEILPNHIEDEMSNYSREKAIEAIIKNIANDSPVISTTGMISRELFELRENSKSGNTREFMLVGGMGHASQVASAVANERPDKQVVCIDGDGSILMHTGSLAYGAEQDNIIHFVLNNGSHDSVGGQPTAARRFSLSKLAKIFGYQNTTSVNNEIDLIRIINLFKKNKKSSFIEILCKRGSRSNLGRPNKTPKDNKNNFIKFLEG